MPGAVSRWGGSKPAGTNSPSVTAPRWPMGTRPTPPHPARRGQTPFGGSAFGGRFPARRGLTPFGGRDAPGRNRTYGLALRRRTLYPLSYRRVVGGGFYRVSAVVRRQGERALEGGPVVHRPGVRPDPVLGRQLEHRPQRRQHALGVPRRAPHAELAVALGQRVGEEQRPRPRRPQRRLVAPAAVVERDQSAGQLAAGLDALDLGLGDVVRPEQ